MAQIDMHRVYFPNPGWCKKVCMMGLGMSIENIQLKNSFPRTFYSLRVILCFFFYLSTFLHQTTSSIFFGVAKKDNEVFYKGATPEIYGESVRRAHVLATTTDKNADVGEEFSFPCVRAPSKSNFLRFIQFAHQYSCW